MEEQEEIARVCSSLSILFSLSISLFSSYIFSYHLSFTSVPTHSCYLLLLFHFQISLLLLHFFSDDYNGIERLFFCFFILYFSFVSMYMFVLVFCGEMAFDTFVCISRIHYIFQRGFVKKDTSRGC